MRRLLFLLVLCLAPLCLPTADARMTIDPHELTVRAGSSVDFSILLENLGDEFAVFEVEADGDGLLVSLSPDALSVAPHASGTIDGRIRAPPWSQGHHRITIALYEGGSRPVERQTIEVNVVPFLGLSAGVAQAVVVATAGLLVAAPAVGWGLHRRWHWLALALYSRIRRQNLEKHPSRALLVALIRNHPGVSQADAQRMSGLANGPFEHHLKKLVRAGRIRVIRDGRARRLTLPELVPVGASYGTSAKVASHVRTRGEVLATDLRRELALSRQALHYHIRKLSAEGLIEARVRGRRLVLTVPSNP